MQLLPENLEEETIIGMIVGDIAYLVPWCVFADEDRSMWINASFSIHHQPAGTVCMKIKRTKDGVIVYEDTIGDNKFRVGKAQYSLSDGHPHKLPVVLKKGK